MDYDSRYKFVESIGTRDGIIIITVTAMDNAGLGESVLVSRVSATEKAILVEDITKRLRGELSAILTEQKSK
jgi:hypothetical protein